MAFIEDEFGRRRLMPYLDYERVTDAATEPITLTEAKTQLRVSGSTSDTEITEFITAARQRAEDWCRRSFITQTWKLYLNDWPSGSSIIKLPRGKVQSITSIKYTASTQFDTTINSSTYNFGGGDVGVIKPVDSWPTTDTDFPRSIEITYVTGYGDAASDVPSPIKHAIKILVTDFYQMRQSFVKGQAGHVSSGSPNIRLTEEFLFEQLLGGYQIYF